jgi:hypothetical protein
MKKLTFTLFSALTVLSASAQLSTYTWNDAPGQAPGSTVIKIDTVSRVQINGGGLPNFAPGNNVTWDMTNVLYEVGADHFDYDTTTLGAFPGATYQNNFDYNLTTTLTYETNVQFAITPTGIQSFGEHIEQQTYPIGIITGNNNDELVLPTQDVVYDNPVMTLPFNCISGVTNWNTNVTYTTDMLLTYTAEGFINQLVNKVTHASRMDSAVGYGEIVALRLDGAQGEPVEVIQIKNYTNIVDSYYVNGVPMDNSVLATFNLSQGQTTAIYEYRYYRAGEVTPMMSVIYEDGFNVQLHNIGLHRQRIPNDAGVSNVKNNAIAAIYPNPATSEVNVAIKNKALTSCNYELVNVIGQSIAKGNTAVTGGNINITVTDVPAGTYCLRLTNNGEVLGQSPLTIVK